jgi:glycosyltransferase involved in cell wall biosynthesis
MKSAETSLIVSTFNRPDALLLSLHSINSQTILPDEVIIADDGSDTKTREAITAILPTMKVPLQHVWHPKQGFRLAAIRNKAIGRCTCPYIIQIDGDIICHTEFVRDHLAYRQHGYFVSGKRCNLCSDDTSKSLAGGGLFCSRDSIPSNKFSYRYRNPLLAAAMRPDPVNRFFQKGVLGCNMAYWRQNALAINGYNEKIEGWGKEDDEFSVRLMNSGIIKRCIRFGGIQYHLCHQLNSMANLAANISILEEAKSLRKTAV